MSGATARAVNGPHDFRALRLLDWLWHGGRCRYCRLPKDAHPVHCEVPARMIGDDSPARMSWENLHVPRAS